MINSINSRTFTEVAGLHEIFSFLVMHQIYNDKEIFIVIVLNVNKQ